MKKSMFISMIALSLAVPGFSRLILSDAVEAGHVDSDGFSAEEIDRYRKGFKDTENLKRFLAKDVVERFYAPYVVTDAFKRRGLDIPDERIREALVSLCRDALEGVEDTPGLEKICRWMNHMGAVADENMKGTLYKIVIDTTRDRDTRALAIWLYARLADAQEMKELFMLFLTDTALQDENNLVWAVVDAVRRGVGVYKEADELKREVIDAALCVIVARADRFKTFFILDLFLSIESREYEISHLRIALLSRFYAVETDPTFQSHLEFALRGIPYIALKGMLEKDGVFRPPHEFPELVPLLDEAGKFALPLRMLPILTDKLTNVNTNLADFAARDFRRPSTKSKP